jgi:formate-dependent nitrite reductase membrane component NrfD
MAEGERTIPTDAEWVRTLRHNPNPNRVPHLQVPSPITRGEAHRPRPDRAARAPTGTAAATSMPVAPAPQQRESEPSYYDVPMLRAPVWRWEIASYFFLGGVSAGAYLVGRMAERFGGRAYRDLARAAAKVSVAAVVPCAPLLIKDLGDPKRFHHMLRVWKPSSPMNLGTWIVTAFSGVAALELLRQWALDRPREEQTSLGRIAEWVRRTDAPIVAITDAAGVPIGLLMAGYTGVLLSGTSTPLWTQNPWLGALFSASAVGTGAAATSLALALEGASPDSPSQRALEQIDTAAHAAEAITLAGYLNKAGPLAKPLTTGRMRHHLWFSGASLVVAELLKHLPFPRKLRRWTTPLASLLGLASGFSLRWAIVHAGKDSGNDPHAARKASRPSPSSNDLAPQ